MRVLAVDFGSKNIGLAVGETSVRIGSPRAPLAASGSLKRDALAIVGVARKEEAELILLGLPIEESGLEGRMAKICRALADQIREIGAEVTMVDERYTSIQAGNSLASAGVPRRKAERLMHGESAMLLIERYSDEETH